ncbi:hypothetical protein ABN222_05900 [Providencia alcalifaciens]
MIDKLYGLKIRNLDGSSFIFNEKTAPATNLWTRYVRTSDGLSPDGGWMTYKWTCPVKIPEGFDWQVIGGNSAEVTFRQVGDRRYVTGTRDLASSFESNGVVTITGLYDANNNYVKIIAYPTEKTQSSIKANFGFRVAGSSIFTNEIPPTGYAYSMKAKVVIDKKFYPQNVFPGLTIENAVYFFYTDDGSSFISLGFENSQRIFVSKSRFNPNSEDYTKASYWVVAFVNMSPSQLDEKGFGLKIRNLKGEVTFNSSFGVMTRPTAVPGNTIPVNAGIRVENISRPMYSPTTLGETFRSDGGAAQFRSIHPGNIDAYTIGLCEVNSWWQRGHHGDYTVARTARPAIILDAADYFPFP